MSKKTKKDRNSRLSINLARNRVIDNCWRDLADDVSVPIKILERAVFVLRHFRCMPTAGSVEDILSKAATIARHNGYNAAVRKIAKKKPKVKRAKSHRSTASKGKFYQSWEWKKLRYNTMKKFTHRCMCCGWQVGDTAHGYLVVDHIKPRSKFPEMALDPGNMQVLCNDCNMGKSNESMDDFRHMDDAFKATMGDYQH